MSRLAWVVADSVGAARELPTLARMVAGEVLAFVVGPPARGHECHRHGAAAVVPVDPGDGLAGDAVVAAMGATAAARGVPDLALFPASADGRDAAGRFSARVGAGVVANVRALAVEGDGLVATTSPPWGSAVVRTAFTGPPPWVVTVRPRAVEPAPVAVTGGPALVEVGVPAAPPRPRVVARHAEDRPGPSLEEAEVVVAGGRGVGSAAGFALVEELAALLGGSAGASRPAVDAGWVPHVAQVGQTGHSVAPLVYLAFGISGASHHLAGIERAAHVVAVNTDRHAPIFEVADLGIVGDAPALLERLVAALRPRA